MDGTSVNLKIRAGGRLDINRDSEVLNRFVRINLDENEVFDGDQRDPLKSFAPHKPELPKPVGIRKLTKEEKAEKLEKERKQQLQLNLQQQQQQKQEEQQQPQPEQKPNDQNQEVPAAGEKTQPTTPREDRTKAKLTQKQLNQELKKRKKKRRKPRPEEVYTDKDRAAAVNLGSRDIKQSLKIKRRQDRSRVMQIPDEAEPGTFLALGNAEMTRGDPGVALLFFHKALELNPAEKNCLVARSKCYLLLGQPDNGLKDAEEALAVDKNFMKAIYQKAEALYYLGDFEHSLMYYHRGLRIRPEHEGFQLGVHKAQKAIENAIGGAFPGAKRSPTVSTGKCSSSKSRTRESATTPSSTKIISSKNTPEPKITDSSQRNTPLARAKTANVVSKGSRLLRELKTDKEYLDSLLTHPDLKCKNKEDDSEIIGYIQEAVDFLNIRQEFWRQQLPNGCK